MMGGPPTTVPAMPRISSLALLLALVLSSCASQSVPPAVEDSGIERGFVFRVGGVNYAVSQRHGVKGGVRVRTRGGVAGTRRGAFTAVNRAFGCQSLSLREVRPVWRVAEGRGQFCEFDRRGGVNR